MAALADKYKRLCLDLPVGVQGKTHWMELLGRAAFGSVGIPEVFSCGEILQ